MSAKFWFEILQIRDQSEDLPDNNNKTHLQDIKCGGVDWIHVSSSDRDQLLAVVNTVMNIPIS
jgi:hypothetical protein